jgi:flagellar biosynthetic protein FliR
MGGEPARVPDWLQPTPTVIMVFSRLAGFLTAAPVFGSAVIPGRVRLAAALVFAAVLAPDVVHPPAVDDWGPLQLGFAAGAEVVVGLALGFAASLLFWGIRTAGALLDVQLGYSAAPVLDPLTGEETDLIGGFAMLFAFVTYLALGGHRWLIAGIAQSYDLLPIGASAATAAAEATGVRLVGQMLTTVVMVGAPAVAALFLTDLALCICSRVVPQLNAFSVLFPARIVVGLTAVALSLPLISGFLADHLLRIAESVATLSRAMQ